HISWVFLTDRRAYKVKKPVRFPFVDYSSLERRRAACAEEVRLNRRFSASVYGGVVALVPRGPHGLAITHEADPHAVEYAVEMSRYDDRTTLAARLTAGSVAERDAISVGDAVAGWHRDAPLDPLSGAAERRLAAIAAETLTTLASTGDVDSRRLAGLD